MTLEQKKTVYRAVADIWLQLLDLRFDSIGSLHFADQDSDCIIVGPIAFMPSQRYGDISHPPRSKCGPFSGTVPWLLALARRDLSYINIEYPLTEEELTNMDAARIAIQKNADFFKKSNDILLSSIALHAIDLRPHNIIVSRDDPTKILAVIDWEGARTAPIWSISPRFFNMSLIYDEELRRETEAMETFLWDEVARRSPLWAQGKKRGQALHDLAQQATGSLMNTAALGLASSIDLHQAY